MLDQTTEQTTEQAQQEPIQLKLADLLLAAQVIQLATQRGAIRAEEMEQVGGLYNRLVTFLQVSGALQPSQPGEPEGDTSGAELPATE
jgi:hypothetical protein